ncbi:MAG: Response regulator receiver [Rhodocyclaceae bacterium]|nr:Response regulator receiver [Rhodocyclaceae bacterium]
MPQERVLVVDDEKLNLLVIDRFLKQEALDLDLQTDPLAAWGRLQDPGSDYALVILDRMMPGLGGLELLRCMKREARFADVPVIMQTAASSPDQVREGLEAGAYYYLTKPYEPEALISIVRGALEDRHGRQQLRRRVARLEETQKLVTTVEYRFVTLDDIGKLVPVLAGLCPAPERVAPGLSDLMVNAVEHGNLGVSYKEKALLKWEGDWEGEIERRLALPQFQGRYGTVRCDRQADRVVFTINDQGDGFDWSKYLHFDPARAFDPNGRGIAMAKMMSFTSLEYRGKGNEVVATVALSG